jgi:mycothiol synthase
MTVKTRERRTSFTRDFVVRPPTMNDLEATVDLFEMVSKHIIGVSDASLDDVRIEWLEPKFDLEKSTLIVIDPNAIAYGSSEGKVIGYIEVWDNNKLPVSIWVWGRVHPQYEGLGIGTSLMEWAEQRANQAISRVPDDLQIVMESGTYHIYEPAHDLFRSMDMELIRHFLTMSIELVGRPSVPDWPGNITIQTYESEAEAETVLRAVLDSFQDHWGYVEQPFEERYERWLHMIRNSKDFDPSLWFLAMDGDEIAGLSLCWPKAKEDPDMGWVGTLGVRRSWRRQGLGLALLHHSFNEFHKRGKARVGLGVDAKSITGATGLYEKAGMRTLPERQFDIYRKVLRPGRDVTRQEI